MGAVCSGGQNSVGDGHANGALSGSSIDVAACKVGSGEFESTETTIHLRGCISSLGYAEIYAANFNNGPAAVIRFNAKSVVTGQNKEVSEEIRQYAKLNHPSVMTVLAARFEIPNICIVTRPLSMGTLEQMLRNAKTKIPQKSKYSILLQVAEGLQYLHAQEPVILHRNVRPTAIWVDAKYQAYLADFGFEKLRAEFRTQSLTTESSAYRDPVLFKGLPLTKESDVYSMGLLMWELWTGKVPFDGVNTVKVGRDILQGIRPEIPGDCPSAYTQLMTRCWDGDKQQRPSLEVYIQDIKALM
eukprot:TRINITY_DN74_c0_g5_i1.p1 TRINITY_DN74_c0_g5~~TRINITY_DN74_c0_g5_i1.p1  ORF type:complete len:332 (-),score=91.93 TRINITY_DN74_c0_g5_i1:655-1554(-)